MSSPTPTVKSTSSVSIPSPTTESTTETSSWIGRDVTSLDQSSTPSTEAEPTLAETLANMFSFGFSSTVKACQDTFSRVQSIFSQPSSLSTKVPTTLKEAIENTQLINSQVFDIILGYCGKVDELIEHIRNNTKISDDLLKYAEKNVDYLDLSKVTLLPSQIITLLGCCKNIKSLNIKLHEIFDDSAKHVASKISSLKNLTSLELSGDVNDDFIGYFLFTTDQKSDSASYCDNLCTLKLIDTNITDVGLELLESSQIGKLTLTHLEIIRNKNITDVGLEHVSKISSIRRLSLRESNVTDSGIVHITNLTELEHLDLKKCYSIINSSLKPISQLTNLRSLNLSGCFNQHCMDDSGIVSYLEGCTKLTWLDLSFCSQINKAELSNVAKFTELEFLNLARCELIENYFTELLHPLKKLKTLILFGTGATAEDIKKIKQEIPGIIVDSL